jgi:hypothetical protein
VLGWWLRMRNPKYIGGPTDSFKRGLLNPAMIVDVRPGGATLMVLAEMTAGPGAPIRYALSTKDVRRLLGHRLIVGERVPVTCYFGRYGRRPRSREGYWDTVEQVPLAWGTPDQEVLRAAVAAIEAEEWNFLASNLDRHRLVSAAPDRIILLTHEELPKTLRAPALR